MARCTAHGKVLPHYDCGESEDWLDDLEARLLAEGLYHQALTVEITRQPEVQDQHQGD